MHSATVALFDDHPIVRQGVRALLEAEPGFMVVGEAENGREAVELAKRLRPDIAVVDLMLPDLNGLEVTRYIHRFNPSTKVLILSMYADEPHVLEALRAGALGYVVKGSSTASLISALRETLDGHRYLSPMLSDWAIEAYIAHAGRVTGQVDRYELLSPREREVFQLAAQGATNAEIAQRLTISSRTAETHRTHLIHKLGLKTQRQLALYALKRGYISEDT